MGDFVHLTPRDIEGAVWLPDGLRVENGIPQGDPAKGGAALLLLSVDDGSPADPSARTVRVLGADGVERVWEGTRISKGGGSDVTVETLGGLTVRGIDPDIVVEHGGVEHRFVKTSFCGGAAFGAWLQSCLSGEEVLRLVQGFDENRWLYGTTVWIFGHLHNCLKNAVLRGRFEALRLEAA